MLDSAQLREGLLGWLDSPAETSREAAERFARGYVDYIKGATANGVEISTSALSPGRATLVSAISVANNKMSHTPVVWCNKIDAALVAYWTTMLPAVFAGAIAPPIVVPGILSVSLLASLPSAGGKTSRLASVWASDLDTFTKSIIITFPSPINTVNIT